MGRFLTLHLYPVTLKNDCIDFIAIMWKKKELKAKNLATKT
jgi:hypothetical protein